MQFYFYGKCWSYCLVFVNELALIYKFEISIWAYIDYEYVTVL